MNTTNASTTVEWVWLPVTWTWWVKVQLALSIAGIIGNLLVIIVIVRRGRSQFSSDVLIASLAFADFSTSLWMIPHLRAERLPPNLTGQIYCRIVYSNILMWISAVASVFILTVISVERFIAVEYPFRFKRMFTVKRSLIIVFITWLGSAILNLFTLAISVHDGETNTCATTLLPRVVNMATGVLLFMFKYLLPIVIMISSHFAIIRSLRAQTRILQMDGKTIPPPVLKLLQTMRDMTRTVLVVVIIFIVCWSPDQVCFLLFNLELYTTYLYSDIYRVFVCLALVNSCCNPFIYSIRNKKFRDAMLGLCKSSSKKLSPIFATTVKSRRIKSISHAFPLGHSQHVTEKVNNDNPLEPKHSVGTGNNI